MEYDITGRRKPIEFMGFKSKLEYIASNWLSLELALKTLYEPMTFKTKIGRYTPDFYCPKIKTYFECKPSIHFANLELYKEFVLNEKKDLVLLTPIQVATIEFCEYPEGPSEVSQSWTYDWTDGDSQLGFCSKCATYFFSHIVGSYHCRACGTHEGDHDQIHLYSASGSDLNDSYFKNGDFIDFPSYYLAAIEKRVLMELYEKH